MKLSDTPEKSTTPGVKNLYRLYGLGGAALADLLTREDEVPQVGQVITIHHPSGDWRKAEVVPVRVEPLLSKVMEGGETLIKAPSLAAIREGLATRFSSFDGTYLRFLNPHIYKVSLSSRLRELKMNYIDRGLREHRHSSGGSSCEGGAM